MKLWWACSILPTTSTYHLCRDEAAVFICHILHHILPLVATVTRKEARKKQGLHRFRIIHLNAIPTSQDPRDCLQSVWWSVSLCYRQWVLSLTLLVCGSLSYRQWVWSLMNGQDKVCLKNDDKQSCDWRCCRCCSHPSWALFDILFCH